MSHEVGKTKSQGWEIGVRHTFPISVERAWELLMTPPGLDVWLGGSTEINFKVGEKYTTETGTQGEIRGYDEGTLLRLTWQPRHAIRSSTLQLRLIPARKGTTISIHHERLTDGVQREQMRQHWSMVLDSIARLMPGSASQPERKTEDQ